MTEVGPADRSRLLQLKRAECSSIVRSRKRKLRELFAVATDGQGIPNQNFQDPDATPTTPAESQFLTATDILQGRSLSDLNFPARQKPHFDAIQRFLAASTKAAVEGSASLPKKSGLENGIHPPNHGAPRGAQTESASGDARHSRTAQTASGGAASTATPTDSPNKANLVLSSVAAGRSRSQDRLAQPAQRLSPSAGLGGPANVGGVARPKQTTTSESPAPVVEFGVTAREGQAGLRDGVLSRPEASSKDPTPASGETTATDTRQDKSDAVVIDQKDQGATDLPTIRLPPGDASKAADIASSPSSTTQTAATPAVHEEVSTDTSPDNDGPQYGEKDEEKPDGRNGEEVGRDHAEIEGDTDLVSKPTVQASPAIPTLHGAEAQLLQESVAARGPSEDRRRTSESSHARLGLSLSTHGPADGATPRQTPSAAKPSTGEIRDSQESSPVEPMSVDTLPSAQLPNASDPTTTGAAAAEIAAPEKPSSAALPPSIPLDKAVGSPSREQQRRTQPPGVNVQADGGASLPTPAEEEGRRPSQQMRALVEKDKTKSKPKPSRVVFGKQQKHLGTVAITPHTQPTDPLLEDYFTPLFVQNFAQQSKWMKHIDQLVHHAHKAISTPDLQTAMLENQACRVLKRVYNLQQQDKWSLRQPKRCPEPTRPPSHWDVLLQEMKWLRTDFREERKWKRAVAKNLARACAEWVSCAPAERKALQVKAVVPSRVAQEPEQDVTMADAVAAGEELNHQASKPEPVIPLSNFDSPLNHEEEAGEDFSETIAPSAIFAMQDEDVIFGLQQSSASDQLLDELPMYGAPLKVPKFDLTGPEYDPDCRWRRPALPLSKYVEGEMVLQSYGPPTRRSRYQHEDEEDESEYHIIFGANAGHLSNSDKANKDVALFNPEMKQIRDRLHSSHQFRPPTEHPMPLQSFYESRTASQWTWVEDDQLKALVREHSYNWSLISGILSTKSMFSSGPERRTPWECFERWVHLEGLPNDMSKTQYFKTYQNRIDAAQRAIQDYNQKLLQQAGTSGSLTPLQRRRPTTTTRVDRRRNQKHLALIDAMRKLAKKRETAIQKQQYAASLAATRKANEPQQQQRGPSKTPREYSIMRHERELQLAEKMAQYAQRQTDMQQRRQSMARSQGQVAAATGAATPVPPQVAAQMAANPLAGAGRANMPSQLAVPGQPRPRMPMQAPANAMAGVQGPVGGGGLVPPMPLNGIPQAQMQALQAVQQGIPMANPRPDINLVLQARRIQDQQRAAVQLQQQQVQQQQQQQQAQQQAHQQQPGQTVQQRPQVVGGPQGSPTGMRPVVNGLNQQNFMANAQAMMASFNPNGGAGMGTPNGGGINMASLPAGSPRPNPVQAPISPAMAGHIRELEQSFKAKDPNLTLEQARQMALNNYQQIVLLQRRNAMASASGGSPQMALANGMPAMTGTSPHQYAQLLRAQQQAQAHAAAAAQQSNQQHQRQPSSGGAPVAK